MAQNNEALYGPAPRHSEHGIGDQVTFRRPCDDEDHTGEILAAIAPHVTLTGQPVPLSYMVDDGTGFPITIYASDIIER